MKNESTIYRVRINGALTQCQHRNEKRAISAAWGEKRRDQNAEISVEMHVKSGTYASSTQVWPRAGNTYSN